MGSDPSTLNPPTIVKDSDRSLVRACLEGDRRAWEALIQRYQRMLWSIPQRCGLGEEDAADVFQTVCVRLVENLPRLRDERSLTNWLITTATRESWRVRRWRRREQAAGLGGGATGDETADLPAEDLLPHEVILRLEEEQLVRVGISELGEGCRTLLELLYHSDPPLAYAEVAERMRVPVGSIGPTRARCLQKLKKKLQQSGF
jgi:RNA polymerase sigma factor (sigma-70 family)